jgi:hypothetical protein
MPHTIQNLEHQAILMCLKWFKKHITRQTIPLICSYMPPMFVSLIFLHKKVKRLGVHYNSNNYQVYSI